MPDQIFVLISSFLKNRRLCVVLDGKSSQYPVNTGVPHASILGPTLFLLYINDLPDYVICNISICADDTTLLSILSVIRHLIYGNNFLSPEVVQIQENVHFPYKNAETNPRINFIHLDIF